MVEKNEGVKLLWGLLASHCDPFLTLALSGGPELWAAEPILLGGSNPGQLCLLRSLCPRTSHTASQPSALCALDEHSIHSQSHEIIFHVSHVVHKGKR